MKNEPNVKVETGGGSFTPSFFGTASGQNVPTSYADNKYLNPPPIKGNYLLKSKVPLRRGSSSVNYFMSSHTPAKA